MKTTLFKFLRLFNRKERFQILALLLLMLIGALLETFVVGIIYPFISILKRPEIVHEHKVLRWIYEAMPIKSTKEFLIWTSVGLILVYLFKNFYLVFLAYAQSRFTFNKLITFSRRLFTFYLHQPYTFHLQRNSAELLFKINTAVASLFNGYMFYLLQFVVEIMTTLFIICLLIFMKPLPSIITGSVLGIITFTFYRRIRKKISELGKVRQLHGERMVVWVNQGLGGIKETKILGREDFFINSYEKNIKEYARAEHFLNIINQIPRPFLETMCIMSMLLIMLSIITRDGEFQSIIPTLSLFAVAAFRLIPSVNRILAAATQIRYHSYSLDVIYNDLTSLNKQDASFKNEPSGFVDKKEFSLKTPCVTTSERTISFDEVIELKNVHYQYPKTHKPVLNGISLTIPRHNSVGLVGPSGAGKTTIVDIIIGLLDPTNGGVLVDGKNIRENLSAWQRKIGYIPQSIYLSDDTILRNIAFGLPDEQIDRDRVWSVLISAQIEEFVNSLSDKLDTFIGERGIRLSGGQRQRIGIARALYHSPEVLVMDEGTASLDSETECEVMQAVKRLSGEKTVIIIAHRLSTVKNCDRLYFIQDGEVINYGTYEGLFNNCIGFKNMVIATEIR